jgi:hypothetical protein
MSILINHGYKWFYQSSAYQAPPASSSHTFDPFIFISKFKIKRIGYTILYPQPSLSLCMINYLARDIGHITKECLCIHWINWACDSGNIVMTNTDLTSFFTCSLAGDDRLYLEILRPNLEQSILMNNIIHSSYNLLWHIKLYINTILLYKGNGQQTKVGCIPWKLSKKWLLWKFLWLQPLYVIRIEALSH